MRWRNVAVILSSLMTIFALSYTAYRGFNMGVDFVGGQMIRVSFEQPINVEQLRGRVDSLHLGESSIQEFGGPKTYQIRLPVPEGGDAAANIAATKAKDMITANYPGAKIDSVEAVSGKVSEELAENGAMAIIFAMIGISIYIWFRFEWQFGVGALVTIAHDVSMILGFFAFSRLQVDLNVVAAFLTVVGYSLNDTVVIYDRIRENLRKYRKMAILPLLNLSLNETLARTVVTSLTVLIALAVLMAIGPEVIFGLSLAIFLGVVVGTYSSIYVSTPVLVWLGVSPDSFVKTPAEGPGQQTA
jgi:preprotein translocase subunit SecF